MPHSVYFECVFTLSSFLCLPKQFTFVYFNDALNDKYII